MRRGEKVNKYDIIAALILALTGAIGFGLWMGSLGAVMFMFSVFMFIGAWIEK